MTDLCDYLLELFFETIFWNYFLKLFLSQVKLVPVILPQVFEIRFAMIAILKFKKNLKIGVEKSSFSKIEGLSFATGNSRISGGFKNAIFERFSSL